MHCAKNQLLEYWGVPSRDAPHPFCCFFKHLFIYCVHMCNMFMNVYMPQNACEVQRITWEIQLSPTMWDSLWLQVFRIGGKFLYLLRHLTALIFIFSSWIFHFINTFLSLYFIINFWDNFPLCRSAWSGVELTIQSRLAMNSQSSACLWLPSAGIEGVGHIPWIT